METKGPTNQWKRSMITNGTVYVSNKESSFTLIPLFNFRIIVIWGFSLWYVHEATNIYLWGFSYKMSNPYPC